MYAIETSATSVEKPVASHSLQETGLVWPYEAEARNGPSSEKKTLDVPKSKVDQLPLLEVPKREMARKP